MDEDFGDFNQIEFDKILNSVRKYGIMNEPPERDIDPKSPLTIKDLRKLATDTGEMSLEAEQVNLQRLKTMMKSIGIDKREGRGNEMRAVQVRLKEAKELYKQTDQILAKAQMSGDSANQQVEKSLRDVLHDVNEFNIDEKLKIMETRITNAKKLMQNSGQNQAIKAALENYHSIFKESMTLFQSIGKPSYEGDPQDLVPKKYRSLKSFLEETDRIVTRDSEQDEGTRKALQELKELDESLTASRAQSSISLLEKESDDEFLREVLINGENPEKNIEYPAIEFKN